MPALTTGSGENAGSDRSKNFSLRFGNPKERETPGLVSLNYLRDGNLHGRNVMGVQDGMNYPSTEEEQGPAAHRY